MPNTEAESVDDMVDASSSDGTRAKWMLVQLIPESQKINSPVTPAVTSTPNVDSIRPGPMTGRIALISVDVPPVKSIIHSATMPTNWAVCMFSKLIPRPSTPKIMPTSRNTSSNGRPVR